MRSMFSYTKAAMERAMKVQEVILRAMARKITWYQAAEIIGISDRHMRRWRERYEEFGYDGLFDRRRGQPSPKRVPVDAEGGRESGCASADASGTGAARVGDPDDSRLLAPGTGTERAQLRHLAGPAAAGVAAAPAADAGGGE